MIVLVIIGLCLFCFFKGYKRGIEKEKLRQQSEMQSLVKIMAQNDFMDNYEVEND